LEEGEEERNGAETREPWLAQPDFEFEEHPVAVPPRGSRIEGCTSIYGNNRGLVAVHARGFWKSDVGITLQIAMAIA